MKNFDTMELAKFLAQPFVGDKAVVWNNTAIEYKCTWLAVRSRRVMQTGNLVRNQKQVAAVR